MEVPKSRGSLKILQSLLKRYQRNKQLALETEESLKDSTEHLYTGEFFVEKTFEEAFQTCESKLVTKVNGAEKTVAEKIAERKSKQQEQEAVVEALVDKIEAAKKYVKIAVEENCAIYLQMTIQTDEEKSLPSKAKLASLYQGYKKAKQEALDIYPDIIKQFYAAVIVDPFTAEKKQESKAVVNWFKYCEEAFAEQTPEKTATLVGPKLPQTKKAPSLDKKPLSTSESTEETDEIEKTVTDIDDKEKPKEKPVEIVARPTEEDEEEDIDETVTPSTEEDEKEDLDETVTPSAEEDIEETVTNSTENEEPLTVTTEDEDTLPEEEEVVVDYEKIMNALQGDRARTLKENNRLPDYVDNEEDDFQAAKTWQYENEDKCVIYQFRGDKLVRTKMVPGECPEF
jgi:hypothetical protein